MFQKKLGLTPGTSLPFLGSDFFRSEAVPIAIEPRLETAWRELSKDSWSTRDLNGRANEVIEKLMEVEPESLRGYLQKPSGRIWVEDRVLLRSALALPFPLATLETRNLVTDEQREIFSWKSKPSILSDVLEQDLPGIIRLNGASCGDDGAHREMDSFFTTRRGFDPLIDLFSSKATWLFIGFRGEPDDVNFGELMEWVQATSRPPSLLFLCPAGREDTVRSQVPSSLVYEIKSYDNGRTELFQLLEPGGSLPGSFGLTSRTDRPGRRPRVPAAAGGAAAETVRNSSQAPSFASSDPRSGSLWVLLMVLLALLGAVGGGAWLWSMRGEEGSEIDQDSASKEAQKIESGEGTGVEKEREPWEDDWTTADYEERCWRTRLADRETCRQRLSVWSEHHVWLDSSILAKEGRLLTAEDLELFYGLHGRRAEASRKAILAFLAAWCHDGKNVQPTETYLLTSDCIKRLPTLAALGLSKDPLAEDTSIFATKYRGKPQIELVDE